jgi:hypothetical protein
MQRSPSQRNDDIALALTKAAHSIGDVRDVADDAICQKIDTVVDSVIGVHVLPIDREMCRLRVFRILAEKAFLTPRQLQRLTGADEEHDG